VTHEYTGGCPTNARTNLGAPPRSFSQRNLKVGARSARFCRAVLSHPHPRDSIWAIDL